jgi:prevent-host-death family protein
MKTVKIADLKDSLSEHLRRVERGGEVVVTDRSRPIARIVPYSANAAVLSVTPPSIAFSAVRRKRFKALRLKVASSALLAQERGDR